MYGADFVPGGAFSRVGIYDVVWGIVTVLDSFFLMFGKTRPKSPVAMVYGIGNPPNPLFFVLLDAWRVWCVYPVAWVLIEGW